MSFDYMTAIKNTKGLKSHYVNLLMMVSYYINPRTGGAWPSTVSLSEDTGIGQRMVKRYVKMLREKGVLVVIDERRYGTAKLPVYVIDMTRLRELLLVGDSELVISGWVLEKSTDFTGVTEGQNILNNDDFAAFNGVKSVYTGVTEGNLTTTSTHIRAVDASYGTQNVNSTGVTECQRGVTEGKPEQSTGVTEGQRGVTECQRGVIQGKNFTFSDTQKNTIEKKEYRKDAGDREACGKLSGNDEKRYQNAHWNSKLQTLETELGEEAVCKGLLGLIVHRDDGAIIELWAANAESRDYFEIDRGAEIAAVLGREKVTVSINAAAVGAERKRQAETAVQRIDQPDLLPGEALALLENARPDLVARLGEDDVERWFDPLVWDLSGGPMIVLYAPLKFGADRARGALGDELEMLTGRRVQFLVGLPPAQGNGSQTGMDLQARHAEGSR